MLHGVEAQLPGTVGWNAFNDVDNNFWGLFMSLLSRKPYIVALAVMVAAAALSMATSLVG